MGKQVSQRRLIAVSACVVVLGLLIAGAAVVRPGPVGDWLGGPEPAPSPSRPPEPEPPAVLAAGGGRSPAPTADGVRAAIDPLVRGSGLGERLHVSVLDLATGESLYQRGPDTPTVPASTTKLVTAVTALAARGPAYRIPTRAVAGAEPGEVVLVGGGDPTLAIDGDGAYPGAARLDELAEQVRGALGDTRVTSVGVDSSLFSGDVYGRWDADIPSGGYVGPVTALMTDGGRVDPTQVEPPAARWPEPDLATGRAFAELLGLGADTEVTRRRAPASPAPATGPPAGAVAAGTELGRVESPPLLNLVELALVHSDNVLAEALARQVALARGEPASYRGAAAAIDDVLAELGLPAGESDLVDGSGLSRADHLTPTLLTDLLALAADPAYPALHGIFGGLPVAGWSGTLADRYRPAQPDAAPGAGVVRAKTGTLYQVNAIAGLVVTADGRALAFALLADQVPVDQFEAQDALDRIAAALAGCGCS